MVEIIGVDDIVKDYNLSRKQVIKLLNIKGCPVLPRQRRGTYKVVRSKFEEWLSSRVR